MIYPHMPKIFLQGGRHFSALEVRESGMGDSLLQTGKQIGPAQQKVMMLELVKSGHPVFRGTSP